MLGRLFLLFTLVPLAEIYLLVQLGGLMGVWPTIALVAVTGFVGAALAKREGQRALTSYQAALAQGKLPEEGIVSGLLILAGGVMLITPGILTDVAGLSLMIPPVRKAVAKLVKARLQKRVSAGDLQVMQVTSGIGGFKVGGFGGHADPADRGSGHAGAIVDAEIVEPSEPRRRS